MQWEQDLIKDIRFGDGFDDHDGPNNGKIVREEPQQQGHEEFSPCNRAELTERFLAIKEQCRAVLEIGVARNGGGSSSYCFLNNKKDETFYVGIDKESKTFLDDAGKRIHTIQADSGDIDQNIEKMKELGIEELDFIFIDGWHSVNQVLKDWEYTKILSKNGIVGFHDTNEHPGPNLFMKALNTDLWDVEMLCKSDWGVGFARRK
jgi:predicted O-methyltransferase YrrM